MGEFAQLAKADFDGEFGDSSRTGDDFSLPLDDDDDDDLLYNLRHIALHVFNLYKCSIGETVDAYYVDAY